MSVRGDPMWAGLFQRVRQLPSIIYPLAGVALIVLALAMLGRSSPPERKEASALEDALDDCSPFDDLRGKRELNFDKGAHTSTLRYVDGPRGDGFTDKYRVNERTHSVFVHLGSGWRRYVLVEGAEISPCILVRNGLTAGRLADAWFGTAPDRPNDDQFPIP